MADHFLRVEDLVHLEGLAGFLVVLELQLPVDFKLIFSSFPLHDLTQLSHWHNQVQFVRGGVVNHLVQLYDVLVVHLLHYLNLTVHFVQSSRESHSPFGATVVIIVRSLKASLFLKLRFKVNFSCLLKVTY